MIVVDTNVIAYLLIPGVFTDQAKATLAKEPHWAAPLLWRSKFRNVLTFYLRKKEFTLNQALLRMQEAEFLLPGGEYEVASLQVLSLTANSNCSAKETLDPHLQPIILTFRIIVTV